MITQNNDPTELQRLWRNKSIDSDSYFFRLKAYELNIATYEMI